MKKLILTAMILGLGVGGAYAQQGSTSPSTSGGGAGNNAAAGVNPTVPAGSELTPDQQRNFRTWFLAEQVEPIATPSFTVAVGTEVPRTVTLRKLPPRIVEAMPTWRSYEYFRLADGRIAVVDPASARIIMVMGG